MDNAGSPRSLPRPELLTLSDLGGEIDHISLAEKA